MTASLKIHVEPKISALTDIAKQIETFCATNEVPMEFSFKINLIVEELITNAISHGKYENRTPDINLSLEWENGGFQLVLEDNADAFDPFEEAPAPTLEGEPEDRPIGGLGLHLVRSMVGETNYERDGDRNRVRLLMAAGAE